VIVLMAEVSGRPIHVSNAKSRRDS